jgi:hypothetical protein
MTILEWAIEELNKLLIKEPEFKEFQKISRFYRDIVITEKIDGTNGQIYIPEKGQIWAGSRNRWLKPGKKTDNHGFAEWVQAHESELRTYLGTGRYYGEWFGANIQRKYGLKEKRYYLFKHPGEGKLPPCCGVVPTLYQGVMTDTIIPDVMTMLRNIGSVAVQGFMKPEGIVVYHTHSGKSFKITLENDKEHKSGIKPTESI